MNGKNEISGTNSEISPFDHIPSDVAYDSEFTERIIEEINVMKDIQSKHEEAICNLISTCDRIADTVDGLQQAEVRRYGIVLKRKIYACLSKGYATPQEYEAIESEYEIYHNILHGNGQIQKLHDLKFLELDVHHDPDDPIPMYGEFDAEFQTD